MVEVVKIDSKLAELRTAILECERQFYLHRGELSDLGSRFWAALGYIIMTAVMADDSRSDPRSDAAIITKSIAANHRILGAPGDFGYGTPCGEALRNLYDRHREVCTLLIGAATSESDKEASHA